MSSPIVVVLGKPTIRKSEYDDLFTFGMCLAARDKILHTTRTPGAARAVVEGYEAGGGTPIYLDTGAPLPDHRQVFVITDAKFQARMDERLPGWRDPLHEGFRDWASIHNPKATSELARLALAALAERGITLPDRG